MRFDKKKSSRFFSWLSSYCKTLQSKLAHPHRYPLPQTFQSLHRLRTLRPALTSPTLAQSLTRTHSHLCRKHERPGIRETVYVIKDLVPKALVFESVNNANVPAPKWDTKFVFRKL